MNSLSIAQKLKVWEYKSYKDIPTAKKAWITIKAKEAGLNPVMVHAGIKATFTRLKQKQVEKFVKVAKNLAESDKGAIPTRKWLKKNGYSRLYSCMENHPELFSCAKQEKKKRTPEEYVKIAEQLAKSNRGKKVFSSKEAKRFMRKAGINSIQEWQKYCRKTEVSPG